MQLPSISNYYPYSSSNYGANSLLVQFDNLKLYYSYETIIAFWSVKTGLKCRVNDWSSTTGKHLNQIEPDKSKRLKGEEFEKLLAETLQALNLTN